jgi:hypothetical protein
MGCEAKIRRRYGSSLLRVSRAEYDEQDIANLARVQILIQSWRRVGDARRAIGRVSREDQEGAQTQPRSQPGATARRDGAIDGGRQQGAGDDAARAAVRAHRWLSGTPPGLFGGLTAHACSRSYHDLYCYTRMPTRRSRGVRWPTRSLARTNATAVCQANPSRAHWTCVIRSCGYRCADGAAWDWHRRGAARQSRRCVALRCVCCVCGVVDACMRAGQQRSRVGAGTHILVH